MMTTVDRILVPVDFSPCCEVALSYAAAMADRFHSEIDVLHILRIQPARSHDAQELRLLARESGDQMQAFVERFEERGVLLHPILRASADETTAIVEAAADGEYDLIAIGANGWGEPRHIGHVTAAILERAECPVVVLHGRERGLRLVTPDRAMPVDLSPWLPPSGSAP